MKETPHEQPAEDALRKLVAEIAADDYRGKIGQPLTNNTAYLEAAALLQTRDLLRNGPTAGRISPPRHKGEPGHDER